MKLFSILSLFLILLSRAEAATLTGLFVPQAPSGKVNLTAEGPVDWLYLGSEPTNSVRKAASARIGEPSFIGEYGPAEVMNTQEFSWTDGSTVPVATNVVQSWGATNLTNGFSIQIPVDTSLTKLKIYLGAFAARGELNVTFDDALETFSGAVDSLVETNGFYFLDVIADKNNAVLTIQYTVAALHDTNGYISLQAIALTTNATPTVTLTSPTNEANILLGTVTWLKADASDSDGVVTNVSFFANGIKVGEALNPPFEFAWTSTNVGNHSITAVATDHNGAQATSGAAQVFVYSSAGAMVSGLSNAPANVNLTTEGISDWVHWGVYTGDSVDRKAGVIPQISQVSMIGSEPIYNYWDNTTAYSWSDGTPNASILNSFTGIYVVGVSNGFRLTVPADTNPKLLKLYLGSFGARGKLTATLSDYSAPVFINRTIDNVGNGPAVVCALNYAAGSMGQTLTINFVTEKMHDLQYGNVTLQAATLVNTVDPLNVFVTSPTNNAVFQVPASIPLHATLTGGNGSPQMVEFYHGLTKLGQASAPPYTFHWTGVSPGDYSVVAKATNELGILQSSAPVRVFVTTTNGFMTGSASASSGTVNLSAEGTADWVHWGLLRKNSLNRKLNVLEQISNFTEIGKGRLDQYGNNLVSFNWSDGTPNLLIGGTATGVFKNQLTNGFQITVPADRTLRRLKVYVGLYGARGNFEAILSDSSAPPYLHSSLESIFSDKTAVHTIEYMAGAPGQTLTIRYTARVLHDVDYGNVTLQAATLSYIAPRISSFVKNQGSVGFNFSTEAGWNYVVESSPSLAPGSWQPVAGYGGTGGIIAFNDTTPAATNRYYRVRMSK